MELKFLQTIQTFANPFLDGLFLLVTMLGEPVFLLLVLCWVYWNVDRQKGLAIGYGLMTSLVLGNGIKDLLHFPRPIGAEGVRSLRTETATGWSFPSAHSQSAGALGMGVALQFPSPGLWTVLLVWVLSVGFSRLYLGLHWPWDVVAGLVLGVLVAILCQRLYHLLANQVVLYGGTLLVLLPFAVMARSADFWKSFSIYVGFAIGALLEERYIRFTPPTNLRLRLVRLLTGGAVLMAVELGGKFLLPDLLWADCLRYGMLAFMATGGCPWLFHRLKA